MAADIRKKSSRNNQNRTKNGVSLAQMRWKLLAKALHEGRVSEADLFFGSVRHFNSFGLLQFLPLDNVKENDRVQQHCDGNDSGAWYQCSCLKEPHFKLKICATPPNISLEDLKGFDNTGNVCIWPSEEVLSYYIMKNKEMFQDKSVLELGGGHTCLAGCVVAATTACSKVLLTDGNSRAVQNVEAILERNSGCFKCSDISARRLRWDDSEDIGGLEEEFDVILAADCLYFDDGRRPLVNTIWRCLKSTGLAIILAPTRGKTFQQFTTLAQEAGFNCDLLMVYDTCVWNLHSRYQQEKSDIYDSSLHYPQMLILRKSLNGFD